MDGGCFLGKGKKDRRIGRRIRKVVVVVVGSSGRLLVRPGSAILMLVTSPASPEREKIMLVECYEVSSIEK